MELVDSLGGHEPAERGRKKRLTQVPHCLERFPSAYRLGRVSQADCEEGVEKFSKGRDNGVFKGATWRG